MFGGCYAVGWLVWRFNGVVEMLVLDLLDLICDCGWFDCVIWVCGVAYTCLLDRFVLVRVVAGCSSLFTCLVVC